MLCLGLKKSLLSPRLELIAQGMAQCTAFCVHISNYLTTYVQFFSSHYLCPILFLSLPISNSLSLITYIQFSFSPMPNHLSLSLSPMSNSYSLITYVQLSFSYYLCPILSLYPMFSFSFSPMSNSLSLSLILSI